MVVRAAGQHIVAQIDQVTCQVLCIFDDFELPGFILVAKRLFEEDRFGRYVIKIRCALDAGECRPLDVLAQRHLFAPGLCVQVVVFAH
ncbi:hypothetical protein ES703_82219 [subsurface metagenome]